MKNIVFIGGGNMASAIVFGLLRAPAPTDSEGRFSGRPGIAPQITVVDPSTSQLNQVQAKADQQAMQHLLTLLREPTDTALQQADLVVLAIKPQHMQQACAALQGRLGNALVVSVAAGIRMHDIARWLGHTYRIVRCMPNTPALIGKGITAAIASPNCSPHDKAMVDILMQATGALIWVNEEQHIDTVTAVSGSGPAYVFYFMEAMIAQAQALGLSPDQAKQLVLATFEGASALALRSAEPVEVLRENVTSKGGTTFAALESMRNHQVAEHIGQAVLAAQRRAKELGDELGTS
jgi:pyrroline-5-carboxylate reductase